MATTSPHYSSKTRQVGPHSTISAYLPRYHPPNGPLARPPATHRNLYANLKRLPVFSYAVLQGQYDPKGLKNADAR
jgi:hypothetical protein